MNRQEEISLRQQICYQKQLLKAQGREIGKMVAIIREQEYKIWELRKHNDILHTKIFNSCWLPPSKTPEQDLVEQLEEEQKKSRDLQKRNALLLGKLYPDVGRPE